MAISEKNGQVPHYSRSTASPTVPSSHHASVSRAYLYNGRHEFPDVRLDDVAAVMLDHLGQHPERALSQRVLARHDERQEDADHEVRREARGQLRSAPLRRSQNLTKTKQSSLSGDNTVFTTRTTEKAEMIQHLCARKLKKTLHFGRNLSSLQKMITYESQLL